MLFYIASAVFLPALHKASAAGLILMHRLASLNLDVALAAAKEAVADKITGTIVKEIYVPNKIVNFVAK